MVLPFGDDGEGEEVVFAGELKDVAKLVRMHRHLVKPVRVLWGFGRWSRAQLLGELAQQEWGMCPGLAEDLATPSAESQALMADQRANLRAEVLQRARDAEA